MQVTATDIKPGALIYLARDRARTGVIVRQDGDMVEVDWLTGPNADERKWTDTDAVGFDFCGEPDDPACGPDLGLRWCDYHLGISPNPYEALPA